eukprot:TRINITY_DN3680_c0_g1_i1.p1 TRINITY_DN3680_c0_g1~~TRINITY_DN3680_c0_g1_i1.p1  ORF type:complete len:303 (-),score=49.24 TRINITY_DN3680_c0_g1_i1:295-1203(-)
MASVSDDDIAKRLREILAEADLTVTSEKTIRQQLEKELGVSLLAKKKFIRREVEEYLTQNQANEEGGAEDDADSLAEDNDRGRAPPPSKKPKSSGNSGQDGRKEPSKGSGGLARLCNLSDSLAAFLGASQLPRTEVVKEMWNYIKANNLQDPNNRKNIKCDEKMQKLLGVKATDMFKINALLSKHIFPTSGESTTPARKPKEGGGGKSGFSAPISVSTELRKFLGCDETELSRPDVVKRMWNYIKEKNLQDPSNKKFIRCDDRLKQLLGVSTFDGFTMMKLLSKHLGKNVANDPVEVEETED